MILYLAIGLALGCAAGFLGFELFKKSIRKRAQAEAQEILDEAKERLELQILDENERLQELEGELWGKEEKFMLALEERIEELQELSEEKKTKLDNQYSQVRQKTVDYEKEIKAGEVNVKTLEEGLNIFRSKINELNQRFVESLTQKTQVSKQQAIEDIGQQLEREYKERAQHLLENIEEDTKEHAETMAKRVLAMVIDRFARPYSAERGIAPVYFETPEQRRVLVDAEGKNLPLIAELTGCDVFVEPEMEMIGVAGFDPVRRELTRRVLERILKEKKPVNQDGIRRMFDNIKKELFRQIKTDGDNLAKELKLEGLHPEVRQMMGSLRYRYSFTQNQYFHCGEVGWLCGLLASELGGVDLKKARRSGMLHDLGKSMDHELDGGHAVIGANFIQARGEAADVVHAVRAHHYDEQPSTDMAYLVIAADAISGARPGARRSTIESYNQKVTELEAIARSFDGVTDCYILSGGREVRVIVNGRRVDDMRALQLSKEIATRVENECNYPGHIKVVVVRETLVVESTMAR